MKPFESKRFFGLTVIQIAILGVLASMLFVFSENNIIVRLQHQAQIRTLNAQIEHYTNQTEINRRKLQELRSNEQDLEKFARENFLMRRPNEDLFLIID